MATQITIDRLAWKCFKHALEDAIGRCNDEDIFIPVRNMLNEIDSENAEIEVDKDA